MVRCTTIAVSLILFSCLTCHHGLEPPIVIPVIVDLPVEPTGGNPVGVWRPHPTHPVDVTLMETDQIPEFVDSLIIGTQLQGIFSISMTQVCSVQAVLTLTPTVYLAGFPDPFVVTITDTLHGSGTYEIINDRIMALPIQSTTFDLDTLGFSSVSDGLDLISPVNTFTYEGMIELQVHFVFHLVVSDMNGIASPGRKFRVKETESAP